MNENYEKKIEKAKEVIDKAELILIGGGAGLSASGGLLYSGERFEKNFADFIKRYKLTDMYTSGFYPFKTEEERWAYWSRHIKLNRWENNTGVVYKDLLKLVRNKEYFVITTNADGQFYKAGFSPDAVFHMQGDYGKLQCSKKCHNKLYDNKSIIEEMVKEQKDCRIPSSLIPECPVCGGDMDPNLRKDNFFVEDDEWHISSERYNDFVSSVKDRKVLFMELGVGYNTPGIIKYPFEQMTMEAENGSLIRMNKDYPEYSKENKEKTITFSEDISLVVSDLKRLINTKGLNP